MTIFDKLPPNGGQLSVMDNFFKTCKCPLFRGFTVILWCSGRNCAKLVLKPLLGKTTSLFQSYVLLLTHKLYYFSLHDDYHPFLYTTRSIYTAATQFLINWTEKRCSKSNILTMNHELVFENSSSAGLYTVPNSIIFLKVIKYLNIRLREIYYPDLEPKTRMRKTELIHLSFVHVYKNILV